jgi:hypothetical protein
MLVPAKCCACGLLSSDQVAAINATKRGDYNTKICGPDPAPCPPCVPIIDPNLFARCEGQTCRIADLRTDPTFTKCGTDQDCMLRKGLECCECGAEGGWVAISRVGAMVLASQVCGGAICPACVPVPPAGTTAVCRNGACTMTP